MFTSFYPVDPSVHYQDWLLRWFVFDDSGQTLIKNLQSKASAQNWIARQLAKAKA